MPLLRVRLAEGREGGRRRGKAQRCSCADGCLRLQAGEQLGCVVDGRVEPACACSGQSPHTPVTGLDCVAGLLRCLRGVPLSCRPHAEELVEQCRCA